MIRRLVVIVIPLFILVGIFVFWISENYTDMPSIVFWLVALALLLWMAAISLRPPK